MRFTNWPPVSRFRQGTLCGRLPEQRQEVAIDEILRRAAARAPDGQAETFELRWLVGLRAIDGALRAIDRGSRVGYAKAWPARVGPPLEEASWCAGRGVVVEETIPEYLEQCLKPVPSGTMTPPSSSTTTAPSIV
jgi:hypothetical protein